MNRREGIRIILGTIIMTTLLTLGAFAASQNVNQLLSPTVMQEDLRYLEDLIKEIHPDPYNSISKEEWRQQWAKLYQRVEKPMTLGDFYFTLLEGMYLVGDAHTSIYIADQGFELPIHFRWLAEGLMVANDYQGVERGDQVLEIGGQSVEKILERLQGIIPAENLHWVKYQGGERRLHTRLWLKHLGLVDPDQKVRLKIKDSTGQVRTVAFDFQREVRTSTTLYRYQLYPEDNLAVLELNTCNNNQQYQEMLAEFFAQVREQGVTRIAIDVRKNTGGNSAVIDEFLTYTNVPKYKGFDGKIHYSPQAVKTSGWFKVITSNLFNNPPHRIKHKEVELYAGELYVLTSKATFSSANWFGVIFQDNQLGTIVGEPTGNAPTSFGFPLADSLPHTGLRVTISHIRWLRPNRDQNSATTLEPDVYIPLTQEDLRLNLDPVLDWLRQ